MAKTYTESEGAIEQARQWADGLDEVTTRIGHRFPRLEPRQQALTYVRGLLDPVERQNGWQLAEQAGSIRTACMGRPVVSEARGSEGQ